VADLFAGSARVSHALKREGYSVIANDFMAYSYVLCSGLVAPDARAYSADRLRPILNTLRTIPGRDGWFARLYGEEARFFHPKNAQRIQAIREAIDTHYNEDRVLRSILLTSLMLAADRVDSTTGVQMAYLKDLAPRAYNDLELRYPPLLPGEATVLQADAVNIAEHIEADLVYLDPPYNQHSYLGNYHIWETLVLWDNPGTYGVARKRGDCRTRKSMFNLKKEAPKAMMGLLSRLHARQVILSFNNEGFFTANQIEEYLKENWYVARLERPYKRYIGAVIGIYNPNGERVGRVSHTTNKEYLFVGTKSRTVYDAISRPREKVRAVAKAFF
jgi:adenine-specific DNA-methyltransferase